MNAFVSIIVTVGGGLGCFLLGMKRLSEGLQSLGGDGLRKFMTLATGRRMAGISTGVASTLIVQSSSIIVVMLVGFVTSGLMTLAQAINVLIGANIGTTFTVWLMAFAPSPEILGLALIAAGTALYFPFRRGRLRHAGMAIAGLGLVFAGMAFMKDGVAPVKESPRLAAALASLSVDGLASAVAVAAASAAFTAVIQSSAASIVIFMALASSGLITYETTVCSLFGANVGTTATGWLAAIGGPRSAKRTALAHTLTNLAGSILILPLALPVLAPAGRAIFGEERLMLAVSCIDTVFATLRGILVFPFAGALARALERMLPDRPEEKPHLSALNRRVAISPVIACEQALEETVFMAESIVEMLAGVRPTLEGRGDEDGENRVLRREETLDGIQREITVFIGEIMTTRLSSATAGLARAILRLADELESVSDEGPAVVKALRRLRGDGGELSAGDRRRILGIHDDLAAFAVFVAGLLKTYGSPENRRATAAAAAHSVKIRDAVRESRRLALVEAGTDGDAPTKILSVLDILNAYDRARGFCMNIAQTLAGGKDSLQKQTPA